MLEAIKAVRELRNEGFMGQISVAVYWNGNELVGPRGIENEADPPYRPLDVQSTTWPTLKGM